MLCNKEGFFLEGFQSRYNRTMSQGFRLVVLSSLFFYFLGLHSEIAGAGFGNLPNQVEPGSEGYDEYFDPPLEAKYKCSICLLGLREPVQTTGNCSHRFCKDCILQHIR